MTAPRRAGWAIPVWRLRWVSPAAWHRVAAGLVLLALAPAALAKLDGSTFEGNDGNLTVDTPGGTDWVTAPNQAIGVDLPSGNTDNSFTQGSKEDDLNVYIGQGSVPPNKNDVTRFYVGSEFRNPVGTTCASGCNFLYLAWVRTATNATDPCPGRANRWQANARDHEQAQLLVWLRQLSSRNDCAWALRT